MICDYALCRIFLKTLSWQPHIAVQEGRQAVITLYKRRLSHLEKEVWSVRDVLVLQTQGDFHLKEWHLLVKNSKVPTQELQRVNITNV